MVVRPRERHMRLVSDHIVEGREADIRPGLSHSSTSIWTSMLFTKGQPWADYIADAR